MRKLPTGTITLLFADIEGSTMLLHELGPERYGAAIAGYRQIVRDAVDRHGGTEVDTEGDGFFVAFSSARRAIGCATDAQAWLLEAGLRVRMGLHTGEPLVVAGDYAGIDVHWTARIAAAGHGGQVLLSQSTRELLDSSQEVRDLGRHRLKDLGEPVRLFQLGLGDFPPLRSLNATNLPIQPTPLIGRDNELREAAYCLAGLAAVGAQRGRLTLAGRLWGGVIGFERTSGTRLHDTERLRYQRLVGEVERTSEMSAAVGQGSAMTLDEAVEYALTTVE